MSPGVNPLKDVEALGKKLGYTQMDKNFHNVSLGQGQEIVAEGAMNTAAFEVHRVILQEGHFYIITNALISFAFLLQFLG